MISKRQDLENVLLFEPKVFKDNRGHFFESYRDSFLKENGLDIKFIQDNEVFSKDVNILRGLHYQLDKPQGKLIHVVAGSINDVIVDIRLGSPDFGKSIMIKLDSISHKILYVPEGFAHGYLVLEENTIIRYKCTNYYNPDSEYGIKWDDEDINIHWGVTNPIISAKDKNLPKLKEQANLPTF